MVKYFSTDKMMIGYKNIKKIRPTDPSYFAYVTRNIAVIFRPN